MGEAVLSLANPIVMLAIVFGVLIVLMVMGAPVSVCLGLTAIMCIFLFLKPEQIVGLAEVGYSRGIDEAFVVVPLFILMAEFLQRGGIAPDLFHVMSKLVGKVAGGLAMATTLTCTVFAAMCGSSPATAATVGKVATQEMIKRGYERHFAVGCTAGGGTLGIMIPPSIAFIIFGIVTQTSIVKLLMAGILPGIVLSALMCVSAYLRVTYNPALVGEDRPSKIFGGQRRYEKRQALIAEGKIAPPSASTYVQRKTSTVQDIKMVTPAIVLIVLVLGSIYTGAATASEASAVGAMGALAIALIKRQMTKKDFMQALMNTARTGSMMVLILIGGFALSMVVGRLGLAEDIATWIANSGINKFVIIGLVYGLWYLLGCVMDPTSMIVLTIPFLFPALVLLGFHPLWIGVVSTLCVEIGMITPPFGLNLFILKLVTGMPISDIIKGALPYVLVLTIGLVILNIFPQLALIIPGTM